MFFVSKGNLFDVHLDSIKFLMAFDVVNYTVLLDKLYEAGIHTFLYGL